MKTRSTRRCVLGLLKCQYYLAGTLYNNQLVDNHPETVDYQDIAHSRLPTEDEAGILCCSYIANSQEAGKAPESNKRH